MDLEGTLVHPHRRNLHTLIYDVLARRLVHMGHSDLILDILWQSKALEFAQSGLVLDCEHGIVLSLGLGGRITTACIGFSFLSETDIKVIYGDDCRFYLVPSATRVIGKYWVCLSPTHAVLPALYMICIEMITRQQTLGRCIQTLETDLDQVIQECFDSPGNQATIRSFYSAVYSQPGRYFRVEVDLSLLLGELKAHGKVLVLITNESEKYVHFVCGYVLGMEWKQLFDEVIPEAGKPDFYITAQSLTAKYPNYSFTSISCHFINDICAPKRYQHWKTVALFPETRSEPHLNPIFSETQSNYWLEFLGVYSDAVYSDLESYLLTC